MKDLSPTDDGSTTPGVQRETTGKRETTSKTDSAQMSKTQSVPPERERDSGVERRQRRQRFQVDVRLRRDFLVDVGRSRIALVLSGNGDENQSDEELQ